MHQTDTIVLSVHYLIFQAMSMTANISQIKPEILRNVAILIIAF